MECINLLPNEQRNNVLNHESEAQGVQFFLFSEAQCNFRQRSTLDLEDSKFAIRLPLRTEAIRL